MQNHREIEYIESVLPLDRNIVRELDELSAAIFGSSDLDFEWRLSNMPNPSVFLARHAGNLIGFKLGYAMTQVKYYSWVGGVHPSFRRQGVAGKLMEMQHNWLAGCGFKIVETAANQENAPMANVNLKHGFSVCGLRSEPHRVQVLFSKQVEHAVSA